MYIKPSGIILRKFRQGTSPICYFICWEKRLCKCYLSSRPWESGRYLLIIDLLPHGARESFRRNVDQQPHIKYLIPFLYTWILECSGIWQIHTYMYVHIYIYYICIYVCMYVCMYVCKIYTHQTSHVRVLISQLATFRFSWFEQDADESAAPGGSVPRVQPLVVDLDGSWMGI